MAAVTTRAMAADMRMPEFTPRISLGDLLTGIVMLVTVTLYGSTIHADVRVERQRIDALKIDQATLRADMQAVEARTIKALERIEAGMNRIEDKLDRKADK